MDFKSDLKWSDVIDCRIDNNGSHQKSAVTIDQLRSRLLADPLGITEKRLQAIISLVVGDTFLKLLTVPAGCILKYVGLFILQPVVAGGTSVKLGLGQHGGTPPSGYGFSAGLGYKDKISALIAPAVLTDDTDIDLSAVITDGSALGDTNITSGVVLASIVFDSPAPFAG